MIFFSARYYVKENDGRSLDRIKNGLQAQMHLIRFLDSAKRAINLGAGS